MEIRRSCLGEDCLVDISHGPDFIKTSHLQEVEFGGNARSVPTSRAASLLVMLLRTVTIMRTPARVRARDRGILLIALSFTIVCICRKTRFGFA